LNYTKSLDTAEIAPVDGNCAVQGHSSSLSLILVPIESSDSLLVNNTNLHRVAHRFRVAAQ